MSYKPLLSPTGGVRTKRSDSSTLVPQTDTACVSFRETMPGDRGALTNLLFLSGVNPPSVEVTGASLLTREPDRAH